MIRVRKKGKYVTEVQMTIKVVKQKHYKLWYAILDDFHIMGVGKTDKEAILNMLESQGGSSYEKNLRYSPQRKRKRGRPKK